MVEVEDPAAVVQALNLDSLVRKPAGADPTRQLRNGTSGKAASRRPRLAGAAGPTSVRPFRPA